MINLHKQIYGLAICLLGLIEPMFAATLLSDSLSTPHPMSQEVLKETDTPLAATNTASESRDKASWVLKTNLLFDAITALNVEAEFPIGPRWSVATEWIFPWWTVNNHKADSKRHRLQLLNGNLEGRYWLGNRTHRAPLTGWFTGLYMGAGLFDLEWKRKGYQGEFFIAAGASIGYTHPIAHNLRMEYALGIGYMKIRYSHYESVYGSDLQWHAMKKESGRQTWLGPTRAKVSLVWTVNCLCKKGGKP